MLFYSVRQTVLAQSAPLNKTLSTAFSIDSKGPTSQGWHYILFFCVCVCISPHKQALHLSLSFKVPCGEQRQQGAVQRTAEENAEGWLTGKQLHTLNQTLGLTQINTQTHIHIHLLHVLNA